MPAERAPGQTRVRDHRGAVTRLVRSELRLRVGSGTLKGKELAFKQPLVRFGTSPENEVVLDDEFVSAHHAELETTEEGLLLRDLRSRNGTQVNGVLIREAFLQPNARITVGDTVLTLSVGSPYEVVLGEEHLQGLVGG